ncbi:hypothetical protein CLOM_g1524 [Closterium sp. NIES-68]|nr:hypothetical protein CLOM_g1524 [Closterium sp. NIES-68]GJP60783.1 hypothetical protein CLOP_g18007 [Closterium sp. NIES-67]GJP60977.1 hypothetical protein CLOP_g18188 [Closterium sp. NIES-67]
MKKGLWNKKGSKGAMAAAAKDEKGKGQDDSSDDGFSFLMLGQDASLAGRALADPNFLVLDSGATSGMLPRPTTGVCEEGGAEGGGGQGRSWAAEKMS